MRYIKLNGTPFDDNKATYDFDEHYYLLKRDYVENRLNISLVERLRTEAEADVFLRDISEQIINYIRGKVKNVNFDIVEYRIAKEDTRGYQSRTTFIKACLYQIRYALRSGGDTLGDAHGIDLKNGTAIQDFDKLRNDLKIGDEVKEILLGGRNPLLFRGTYEFEVDPVDYRRNY